MRKDQARRNADSDDARLTRRAAIGAGAAAYGAAALWGAVASGTPAFARTLPSQQLLADLQRGVAASKVERRLRGRLLTILREVETDLRAGHRPAARATLQNRLIPLIRRNAGHRGLTARKARKWVADANKLVSSIAGLGSPRSLYSAVYAFNCYGEPISSLAVGGQSVGDVPAWSYGAGGQPTKYTPAGRPVPRSKYPTQGQFAIGDNSIAIPWDSFTGTATIKIPDPARTPVSLNDDLILYLTPNKAMLLTTRGYVLDMFDVGSSPHW